MMPASINKSIMLKVRVMSKYEIVRIFEVMGTLHRGGLKLFKKNTVTESIQMYKTKLACTQANKITWGYDN